METDDPTKPLLKVDSPANASGSDFSDTEFVKNSHIDKGKLKLLFKTPANFASSTGYNIRTSRPNPSSAVHTPAASLFGGSSGLQPPNDANSNTYNPYFDNAFAVYGATEDLTNSDAEDNSDERARYYPDDVLKFDPASAAAGSKRNYYNDFTTIDWVKDTINESARRSALEETSGIRGRFLRLFDAAQGWILIAIIAFAFACVAYMVAQSEEYLSYLRLGYCRSAPWRAHKNCEDFVLWTEYFGTPAAFLFYILYTCTMTFIACKLTLATKTDNLLMVGSEQADLASSTAPLAPQPKIYSAYGSGVPEVKTILSGFIIRKYLGYETLVVKTVGLVLAVSSGLSLGKEGPFVHLATCVGNIACRLFVKFSTNEMKRRQILAAAASAGIALAFGAPLGGVLFSLEELGYYFLPHQLFRIFFCAMSSIFFFKFMNPYGTGKTVIFEVQYSSEWQLWEILCYVFMGVCGGIFGALFAKFAIWWSKTFRSLKFIKNNPAFEVALVTLITGLVTFGDPITRKPTAELLFELASPCDKNPELNIMCPLHPAQIPSILSSLGYALAVKIVLSSITFGLKVPSGIFIPSMIVGALFGRVFNMLLVMAHLADFDVTMTSAGIYAMISAGAFMAGVTRMNVTLAVIMFEITGSLNHVLPFSIAILFANWVANIIEPFSLYSLIIKKSKYPYLDTSRTLSFDSALADIVTKADPKEVIELSESAYIPAARLTAMLQRLQHRGEYDAAIPLVDNGIPVGLLPAPELEMVLDELSEMFHEANIDGPIFCKISVRDEDVSKFHHYYGPSRAPSMVFTDEDGQRNRVRRRLRTHTQTIGHQIAQISDLTKFVDRAPVTMDIHTPLALVHMMFSRVGVREICTVSNGKFVGLLHKKQWIDFVSKANN